MELLPNVTPVDGLFMESPEDPQVTSPGGQEPLAARMRPRSLADIAGQQHILGEGKLLRRAIEADRFTSLIFYGPPGTGEAQPPPATAPFPPL